MTEKFEDTISVPNSEFVSTMEKLLNNEAITKIDVTYYVSGGCNLKAYIGTAEKKYYVHDKPANKTGRFDGEMGWLLSDRQDVTSTHKKSHGWINYIIERIEDESTPDATVQVSESHEKTTRDRYVPKTMGMSTEEKAQQNILSVVMGELRHHQVEAVSIRHDKAAGLAGIHIFAFDNSGSMEKISESSVSFKDETLDEAFAYIKANTKYFEERYSCSVTLHIDSRGITTAIDFKRIPEMARLTPKYRKELLNKDVFINNARGDLDIQVFFEIHFSNKYVNQYVGSMVAYKRSEDSAYVVSVKMKSELFIQYRLAVEDFPAFHAYLQADVYNIMWDGFVSKVVVDAPGADIESMLKIDRLPSADSEDGFLIARNIPLFVREFIENPKDYEFRLDINYRTATKAMGQYATISTVDAAKGTKSIFDVKAPLEEVTEFMTWIKRHISMLETSYSCKIEWMNDESWGHSLRIQKNTRYSWDHYVGIDSTSQDAVHFVAEAYKAGIGIVVTGSEKSNKTRFLSTLCENNSDTNLTVFTDPASKVKIPDTVENVVVIAGTATHSLKAAIKIAPERVIFDDPGADGKFLLFRAASEKGIQLVMATELTANGIFEYSGLADTDYPFEVAVVLNDTGEIESISQLITAKKSYSETRLWYRKDGEFCKDPGNNGPSRNLRRKIEATLDAKAKVAANSALSKAQTVANGYDSTKLVTVSESEKREIKAALALLQSIVDRF